MKARANRRRRLELQGKWSQPGRAGLRVHTTIAAAIAGRGLFRITRAMRLPAFSPWRWANTPGDE